MTFYILASLSKSSHFLIFLWVSPGPKGSLRGAGGLFFQTIRSTTLRPQPLNAAPFSAVGLIIRAGGFAPPTPALPGRAIPIEPESAADERRRTLGEDSFGGSQPVANQPVGPFIGDFDYQLIGSRFQCFADINLERRLP